jgi:hypothetical protein
LLGVEANLPCHREILPDLPLRLDDLPLRLDDLPLRLDDLPLRLDKRVGVGSPWLWIRP